MRLLSGLSSRTLIKDSVHSYIAVLSELMRELELLEYVMVVGPGGGGGHSCMCMASVLVFMMKG